MILCDVSVLVNASAERAAHHAPCRKALDDLTGRDDPFGFSDIVLAAVVRVTTNSKIFKPPASPESAFAFTDALRRHPRAISIAPGRRHWRIFRDLVLSTGMRGSDTTDAYLAALAIEHECEWWTTDDDFGRFAGLRWRNLLIS